MQQEDRLKDALMLELQETPCRPPHRRTQSALDLRGSRFELGMEAAAVARLAASPLPHLHMLDLSGLQLGHMGAMWCNLRCGMGASAGSAS
jgi:hypothetical protein